MPKYDSRLISSSTITLAIGRQSDSETQTGRPPYNGNNWSHPMLRMAMRRNNTTVLEGYRMKHGNSKNEYDYYRTNWN